MLFSRARKVQPASVQERVHRDEEGAHLVVDAEASSRETISRMMGQIGYEAVAAGHAREALDG